MAQVPKGERDRRLDELGQDIAEGKRATQARDDSVLEGSTEGRNGRTERFFALTRVMDKAGGDLQSLMHPDELSNYARLAHEDPALVPELDAYIATLEAVSGEPGAADVPKARLDPSFHEQVEEMKRGGSRRATETEEDEAAEFGGDSGIPGRGAWRDSNTMFDERHGEPGEFSSHSYGGKRWSWRPNYDLHSEQYNWLPLRDRVFPERPLPPPRAHSFVPPVAGDEELTSAEYEPERIDPLTLDAADSGREKSGFPVVTPIERFPQIDEHGLATGIGSRKTARAHARIGLIPDGSPPRFIINGATLSEYFPQWLYRDACLQPFLVTETMDDFHVFVDVSGGGVSGQSEAVRMAVSNALVHMQPAYRNVLKYALFLRRDPRRVQPKIAGRKKARKMKQWRKR